MQNVHNLSEVILQIAQKTLEELSTLNLTPCPRRYRETFWKLFQEATNLTQQDLLKNESCIILDLANNQTTNQIDTKGQANLQASYKLFEDISSCLTACMNKVESIHADTQFYDILENINSLQTTIIAKIQAVDKTIELLELEIERLKNESNMDYLTKAFSRRAFFQDLEEILKHGDKRDLDVDVVLIDVDNFKQINDSFGHVVGDKMLTLLSELIKKNLRSGTKLYRYGGEEFAIILNRSKEQACNIIGRIVQEVNHSNFSHESKNVHLTLSAGICSHQKNISLEAFLEKADKALYEAKLSGKNCYKVAY